MHVFGGFWGMQITPVYVSNRNPQSRANCGRMIYLHPCHPCGVFKWSLCIHVCVCARMHGRALWSHPYWFQRLSMDICKRKIRWNSFRKVYLLSKLFESCLVWQGSENTFLMCHNFCFLFCLIFHAGMGEEKVLLWINKESLQLLRDGSFAFLRFCMGSQELQSTIKPVPCISDFFTLSGWHGHTEILCLWCQCLWVVWKNLRLGIPPGRA